MLVHEVKDAINRVAGYKEIKSSSRGTECGGDEITLVIEHCEVPF